MAAKQTKKKPTTSCPCGTGDKFNDCCAPLLRRQRGATTAVELMRSRYTAFVKGNESYVDWSWHPEQRPADVGSIPDEGWEPLEILASAGGGPEDASGTVEFRTAYRHGDHAHTLHEVSMFTRYDDPDFGERWVYLTGSAPS